MAKGMMLIRDTVVIFVLLCLFSSHCPCVDGYALTRSNSNSNTFTSSSTNTSFSANTNNLTSTVTVTITATETKTTTATSTTNGESNKNKKRERFKVKIQDSNTKNNSNFRIKLNGSSFIKNKSSFVQNKSSLYNRAYHLLFKDGGITETLKQPIITEESHGQQQPVVIYAHQREVVHASNLQYDEPKSISGRKRHGDVILTSDDATTCHILALRSYHNGHDQHRQESNDSKKTENRILGSLCHLDSTSYHACLEKMLQRHLSFHSPREHQTVTKMTGENLNIHNRNYNYNHDDDDMHKITMEIHLVGGYNDSKLTSHKMTTHLFEFLDNMSIRYKPIMDCMLHTCIISSLNDATSYEDSGSCSSSNRITGTSNDIVSSGNRVMSGSSTNNKCSSSHSSNSNSISSDVMSAPIVRGLALNVNTGGVQLINKVDASLRGPEQILRKVRSYCSNDNDNGDYYDGADVGEYEYYANRLNADTATTNTNAHNHNFNSLLEVHSYTKDQIYIPPFEFKAPMESMTDLNLMNRLSDEKLLSFYSTSPEVEDEDFCKSMRESCRFFKNESVDSVFGGDNADSVVNDNGSSINSSSGRKKLHDNEYDNDDQKTNASSKASERKPLIYEYSGDDSWDRI